MSETSPTEQGDAQAGSQSDLPAQGTQPSADEQQTESVSGGSQDTDQNDNNQPGGDQSTDDDSSSSDDDDGLANFAKGQGIDNLDDLSDRERKLLKTAHDNQKAFRTTKQQESDKLRETVEDVNGVDDRELEDLAPDEADNIRTKSEIAQLRAEQRVNNFYIRNPDATQYDKEMTQIVIEEAKNNGKDAARYLAGNLDRLLVLAKARRGVGTEQAKADGAREERENLRRRQEAAPDNAHAQDNNRSSKKVTREDITKMSDDEYTEFKKSGGLQAAIERGDLY